MSIYQSKKSKRMLPRTCGECEFATTKKIATHDGGTYDMNVCRHPLSKDKNGIASAIMPSMPPEPSYCGLSKTSFFSMLNVAERLFGRAMRTEKIKHKEALAHSGQVGGAKSSEGQEKNSSQPQ